MKETFGDSLDALGEFYSDPSALIQFPIIEIKEGNMQGTSFPCEGCPNALRKANGSVAIVLQNTLVQEKSSLDMHLSLAQAAASHGLILRKQTVASIVCAHGGDPIFMGATPKNRSFPLVELREFNCDKKPSN